MNGTATDRNLLFGQDGSLANSSFFAALTQNWIWGALKLSNQDPQIELTTLDKSTTTLTYTVGNGNSSLALPLVAMLLQPNAIIVPVWCTYPLSGQYDVLPRFLFYVTLVLAVLFRRSQFIAKAALVTAITYSSVAVVHMWVLLAAFHYRSPPKWNSEDSKQFGDIDFFGIIPILSAAGVMLAPIFTWSSTFRSHKARPVLILWGISIFTALIPALDILRRFIRNSWTMNTPPSLAMCTSTDPRCQWTELATELHFTWEKYKQCGCTDFCALLSPHALLRSNQNMVVDLHRQITQNTHLGGRWRRFYIAIAVVWVFATGQGILSLFWSHPKWSEPTKIRNMLFNLLYHRPPALLAKFFRGARRRRFEARHNITADNPKHKVGAWWFFRRYLAATLASIVYGLEMLGVFIYPVTFMATIVVNELLAAQFPVSEHSDAIGAWSPWLGLGLVGLAYFIMRWHKKLSGCSMAFVIWAINWARFASGERKKFKCLVDDYQNLDDDEQRREKFLVVFKRECQAEVDKILIAIPKGLREFWEWWKNPVVVSNLDPVEATLLDQELSNMEEGKQIRDDIRLVQGSSEASSAERVVEA